MDLLADSLGVDRRILYPGFDAQVLEVFYESVKYSMGVREVNDKVYLDIRKYFKNLILGFAVVMLLALNLVMFGIPPKLIDYTLFIYGALFAVFTLIILAECQPLLSYVIRTRIGRRGGAS